MSSVELSKQEVLGLVKSSLELTDDSIKLFSEFTRAFNKTDANSKDIFILINELYRKHDKGVVSLHLGRLFNVISNENDAIVKRLKVISQLAKSSVDLKVILKFEYSFFYNIEASIKLFEALTKASKENVIKECRKELFNLYSDKDTMAIYNNKVAKKISELRKTYGIVDVDGITIVTNIKKQVEKLNNSEKKELLVYLQSQIVVE